jgi:hypothetical protein
LPKPETRPYLMLAPGERIDLWLDFSGHAVGSELVMYSLPYEYSPRGKSNFCSSSSVTVIMPAKPL